MRSAGATAAVLVIVAGCGGKAVIDPEAGGAGAGGAAPGGGSAAGATGGAGADPACAVATELDPPYPVMLRFANATSSTVYLRQECKTVFSIRACADGYAVPLAIWPDCTPDCASPECVDCEPCPDQGLAIEPGSTLERAWPATTYTFAPAQGCQCHYEEAAPAGTYRIDVPVWSMDPTAPVEVPPQNLVSLDFDLPAPQGVVEVSVYP